MVFFSKIKNKFRAYFIFKKNLKKFELVEPIMALNYENYQLRGAEVADLCKIKPMFLRLNGGEFSEPNEKLLKVHPGKTVVVSESIVGDRREIVGIDLFYLNARDLRENTVHEGFIGVLPEYEGQGIATAMRKLAIKHFESSGFQGISTRISKNNIGSLRSAVKLGFKPVEEYFDMRMGEVRHYLIFDFESSREQ